jgi:zinc metalloprotease ZmpB
VHADGEIWSAALWEIRSVFGGTRADTLILQHQFLLAPASTFNQPANALVTTAKNLGFTNGELNSLRTVLTRRGFTVSV